MAKTDQSRSSEMLFPHWSNLTPKSQWTKVNSSLHFTVQ